MGSEAARALAYFLFCLFSLFSFSSAAAPNPQWSIDVTLYAFLAMAVVVSAAFIGLAYMLSQLLDVPALSAWVKIEVQELVISAVIVVFLVAMVASINTAVQFTTGDASAYDAAKNYLNDSGNMGIALHEEIVEAGFWVNVAGGFSYSSAVSITPIKVGGNWGSAPMSGLGGLVGALGNAADSVALTVLLVSAQKAFLVFFMSIAAIMMPLGVVMRTFPLTRKLGALFLGAGAGAAIAYPTALVVAKEVYGNYSEALGEKVSNAAIGIPHLDNPPASKLMCNPKVQFFTSGFGAGELGWWVAICTPVCAVACTSSNVAYFACFAECFMHTCRVPTEKWYSVGASAVAMGMGIAAKSYIREFDAREYFEPVNARMLPAATEYIVLMVVLFLLPLIFALVLTRNFIVIFGGESQLYGLFRLVG